jgi:hypothetical protein
MTKEKVAGPWEFFAAAFVDISIALVDEVSGLQPPKQASLSYLPTPLGSPFRMVVLVPYLPQSMRSMRANSA